MNIEQYTLVGMVVSGSGLIFLIQHLTFWAHKKSNGNKLLTWLITLGVFWGSIFLITATVA